MTFSKGPRDAIMPTRMAAGVDDGSSAKIVYLTHY